MAGTEDISLKVALDDRQAKAGLDALRAQTEAVAAAADSGAGGLGKLQQRVDGVNKLAGPAASAISGVTGAVGGLSSQAGAAVGAVANLAGAFASGGPLALAIVGIGTGVSWLTSKYQESAKAAQQSADEQTKAINATANRIEQLTQGVQGRISAALGIDEATLAMGQLDIKVKNAKASLDELQTVAGRQQFMGQFIRDGGKATEVSQAYAQKIEESKKSLSLLRDEFAKAKPQFDSYNQTLAIANRLEAKKKEADDAVKDALTKKTAAIKNDTKAIRDNEAAMDDVIRRMREQEDFAASVGPTAEMFQQAQVERARKAAQEAEKEHTRILQEESKKQQEASDAAAKKRQEDAQTTAGYVSAFTGIIVGQSQQLIDDLIMGQEKAFERFFAGVMKQAGTVLIGKGIELVGSGTANLLLGNPAGAAQLAVGGSMIAGGVTLGGIGAGIERGLMGGSAPTGAGTAGPSTATTATPMGAGRISSGGRDGGGPMQEAITYVFNAPVFGDQNRSAKQVAMLQRRARRDLLLA